MITEIEEGQKLKDGDYFKGGTIQQYQELLNIENDSYMITASVMTSCLADSYIDGEIFLNHGNYSNNKNQYSFEAFKQLCENTFGS